MSIRHVTFNVTFISYSGSLSTLAKSVDKDVAKHIIRRRLRRAKRLGSPVQKIEKGVW